MAVFKDLNDRIPDINTAWNGKSGEQVEHFQEFSWRNVL